ncbi:type II secretion system minor pseudopilin GspH [Desulfurivibrio alkaliphilus]|uniref:Type II secretion system protein H n=1 Tax=Desulfurivibrio alkaliphilus (strain DSM 19089 / UNIQEM U267 / AHT2) TaxID=589865 RepID=D6Z6G6_DESAT|nr:type II secretion system minor pseudopilin GspH [Desulfurivibrio alkaliphilus]ADH86931.1 general secretion pathway protein H [Desulfurivibrio alkaliphilus AHT 2]
MALVNGNNNSGFTLIEVIVVLLIIGLLVGVVGLSLGSRDRPLETEAERLAALLRLAGQETLLTSTPTAVGFHAEGYRFYRYDLAGGDWHLLAAGALRPRQLDHDFILELRLLEEDDTPVNLPYLDYEDDQRLLPRIYFFPGGELTPFAVTLAADTVARRYTVQGNLQGEIGVEIEELRRPGGW